MTFPDSGIVSICKTELEKCDGEMNKTRNFVIKYFENYGIL